MFLVDIQLTQRQSWEESQQFMQLLTERTQLNNSDCMLYWAMKLSTALCTELYLAAYDSANLETNSSLVVYDINLIQN